MKLWADVEISCLVGFVGSCRIRGVSAFLKSCSIELKTEAFILQCLLLETGPKSHIKKREFCDPDRTFPFLFLPDPARVMAPKKKPAASRMPQRSVGLQAWMISQLC